MIVSSLLAQDQEVNVTAAPV